MKTKKLANNARISSNLGKFLLVCVVGIGLIAFTSGGVFSKFRTSQAAKSEPSSQVSAPTPAATPTAVINKARVFKKSMVFKKAQAELGYAAVRVASNSIPGVVASVPHGYTPQVYNPPAYNPPAYNPPVTIRIPPPSYVSPVSSFTYTPPKTVLFDPVVSRPMYFQGPGIPYSNPHYVPPINVYTPPVYTPPMTVYTPPMTIYTPPISSFRMPQMPVIIQPMYRFP